MLFWIPLFLVAFLSHALELPQTWTEFSLGFHELCLDLAPGSHYRSQYQALVCGSNLSQDEFFEALRKTSLLHLAIVSGSHLILLQSLLERILPQNKLKHFSVLFLISVYTLSTGSQPPAVRALFSVFLQLLNDKAALRWRGHQLTLFAGFATWCFFPYWAYSYSFLLSWGAALGLSFLTRGQASGFRSEWKSHLMVYLVLTPLLMPFGVTHPSSVLFNWLIGPLLSALLFPLSLLAFLLPFTLPLTDFFWSMTEKSILFMGDFVPSPEIQIDIPILSFWPYLFALHTILQFFEYNKRKL